MPNRLRHAVLCIAALVALTTDVHAERPTLHAEIDPLPFALGGYGIQIGLAHKALPGWRFGLGNFSLEVPDASSQLNSDNKGFHLKVRRSHALYALRFFSTDRRGWCVGGSARYLRLEYTHDDSPGAKARLAEVSVEAIGGYKWHPFKAGFYVMPWLAIALPLYATADPVVGDSEYNPDPLSVFATANLGWQF